MQKTSGNIECDRQRRAHDGVRENLWHPDCQCRRNRESSLCGGRDSRATCRASTTTASGVTPGRFTCVAPTAANGRTDGRSTASHHGSSLWFPAPPRQSAVSRHRRTSRGFPLRAPCGKDTDSVQCTECGVQPCLRRTTVRPLRKSCQLPTAHCQPYRHLSPVTHYPSHFVTCHWSLSLGQ